VISLVLAASEQAAEETALGLRRRTLDRFRVRTVGVRRERRSVFRQRSDLRKCRHLALELEAVRARVNFDVGFRLVFDPDSLDQNPVQVMPILRGELFVVTICILLGVGEAQGSRTRMFGGVGWKERRQLEFCRLYTRSGSDS
jgi:hypothetical protein